MAIPPPPPVDQLSGSVPPPPPVEQLGGGVPPPPPVNQLHSANGGFMDAIGEMGHQVQTFADKFGHDVEGGIQSGQMNGFGGLVARKFYENTDVGMDVLRQAHPEATPEQLKAMQKGVINSSVLDLRKQADQEMQQGGSLNFKTPFGEVNPVGAVSGMIGAADPTLAIPIPGAAPLARGVMGVAGNMARSAVGHAAFGGTADLAYQTADMLDGLQDHIDAGRVVSAAAGMGALGTVSPFVHGLFANRGVDTKPGDIPSTATHPLTGEGLTPEEQSQYHDLMMTGSHADVMNFFKDKNVQAPSHEDVHNWMKYRDGVPEGFADPDHMPAVGDLDHRQVMSDYIDNLTKGWKNKPDVEVINHTDDIEDPNVRRQAEKDGANEDALGFVGADGKVRIFANKIAAQADPQAALHAVLYHEALGHYGLAQRFGMGLDNTIRTLDERNVGQFKKDVDQWMKDNPGAYNGDRTRAAEEVLAKMSEGGALKKSLSDALVGHMRRFGRSMGIELGYSDAEVRNILRMAHDAVIDGPHRDARQTGFTGNKFLFTGQKATGFSPTDKTAFRAPDGFIRNEISDKDSRLIKFPVDGPQKLSSILQHDRLYEQYPHLADMTVHGGPYREKMGLDGGYAPSLRSMVIDNTVHPKLMHGAIIHELQHAIQHIEGHSNGVNAGDADVYRRSLGEVEARSAEARMHLAQEDLAKSPAYASQGVKRSEVIVTPAAKDSKLIPPKPPGSTVDVAAADSNRFMRVNDLHPKDVSDETWDRLNRAYTPGTRTHQEALDMARNSPLDPEAIERFRNTGNLDRKMFILDEAAKETNAKLLEIRNRADADGHLSAEDHAEAIAVLGQHNNILGRIEENATQIARGLNAMKAVQFSRNNLIKLKAALEAEGTNFEALTDPDTMNKFLKQYFNMQTSGNPAGAGKMLKAISKPYWWQYLLTWRQNMMLSGLSTHVKSTMDMATMAGREIQETALAMPGSLVRESLRSLGMKNIQPGVHPTELASRLWGLARAAMEAKTWVDTWDAARGKSTATPRYANISDPHIPIVSKVTDLVSAQDQFFRAFMNNANLYALGARKAYAEMKLKGGTVDWGKVMDYGAAHAHMPDPEMLKMARDMTEQAILLNRSGFNQGIDKMRVIRPNMNGGEQALSFVSNLLTPFIRIGANAVQNQIIRRSPLAFLDKVTRDDFAAGGARADIATARILMGTALMVSYWNAADPKNKKLEGSGPENYNKMREKVAGGYSPDSVHENGQYNKTSNLNISLNPLDMHNNIATMVAGMREAYETGKDSKNMATGLTMAFNQVMHSLANQTFINDIQPTIDAVSDKHDTMGVKTGKVLGEQAKTFLPNLATQTNNAFIDKNRRDVKSDTALGTAANVVKDAVPGLSQTLPAKQSVYGEPEKTGTDIIGVHNWLTAGNHTKETQDPTKQELSRLASLTPAAIVTPAATSFIVDKVPIKLTPEQHEEYQHKVGQAIQDGVRSLQQSGEWDKMDDKARIQYVRDVQKGSKTVIKNNLLNTDGWLTEDQIRDFGKKHDGH